MVFGSIELNVIFGGQLFKQIYLYKSNGYLHEVHDYVSALKQVKQGSTHGRHVKQENRFEHFLSRSIPNPKFCSLQWH